jgi:hypothetical protein
MKKIICGNILLLTLVTGFAQNNYPEPEFMNEVYSYRKDSVVKLMRLEKTSSRLDSKSKMGGFGGAETSYIIEGASSPVVLHTYQTSFVIYNGGNKSSFNMDSMMRANGLDPSKTPPIPGFGGGDPSSSLNLYKVTVESSNRKIIYMKVGGAFGGKKSKSSEKPGYSIRKVRDGYWEIVLDKPLTKGEYAFTAAGVGSMDGGVAVFAFRVD